MSADLPDGAVTAAQEYDLAHRDDADQPRWQTWSRVDDHQVTRLLAGALPALTAAIAERAAAAERAKLADVISPERFRMLADWLETSPRFIDMADTEVQDDFRRFAALLEGDADGR